jgi:outer membrane protein assembly factor BamB
LEIPIKFQGIKQIKLIGESFILFRNGIENKWDIKCIDYSGKLLWIINEKNPVLAQMFGERLVFCHYTAHLLTCHRLSDGGELWRLDVCELGRYERFVDTSESEWIDGAIVFMEAWKNILCLVLGNDKILGIDIETGTIQWQRQMPVRIITAPLFHEGRLYWFSLGNLMQYCVVNMLTGANVQNPQVLSPLFRAGLIFTQPIMHGNKILMTADSSRIIYIVDRQTGLVDFTVPLSGEGSRIPVANAPMIQSNHLYQLDGDNVLHIFEVQNKF